MPLIYKLTAYCWKTSPWNSRAEKKTKEAQPRWAVSDSPTPRYLYYYSNCGWGGGSLASLAAASGCDRESSGPGTELNGAVTNTTSPDQGGSAISSRQTPTSCAKICLIISAPSSWKREPIVETQREVDSREQKVSLQLQLHLLSEGEKEKSMNSSWSHCPSDNPTSDSVFKPSDVHRDRSQSWLSSCPFHRFERPGFRKSGSFLTWRDRVKTFQEHALNWVLSQNYFPC